MPRMHSPPGAHVLTMCGAVQPRRALQSLQAFTLETTALPVADPPCAHYSEVYDFGSGCLCCSPDGDLSRLLADLRSACSHACMRTCARARTHAYACIHSHAEHCFGSSPFV